MGRLKLWTMSTIAFYRWQFEYTEIRWRDPEAHCRVIHPPLYTIPGSWKCPCSPIACILTIHVTHWACLRCSGSTCVTVYYSSRQHLATLHSHWRGVGQHSTGHNQQPDQLYAKEMCHAAWGKQWSHQILTGFLIHPTGICDQQMHICILSHVKSID